MTAHTSILDQVDKGESEKALEIGEEQRLLSFSPGMRRQEDAAADEL